MMDLNFMVELKVQKNLISYGNFDDSFDWQDGWRGQDNTNWYAYQVNTGNFGMEIEVKQ